MKVPEKGKYKTPREALKAAYAIIKNPKHWSQGALARDCHNEELPQVRTPKSVAFCAMGAVLFVNGPGERKAIRLLSEVASEIAKNELAEDLEGPDAVFIVNDYGDKKKARKLILKMFKRSIELA